MENENQRPLILHFQFSIALLLEQLQVDMNPHFFAEATGRCVPDQTPMLAVDFGLGIVKPAFVFPQGNLGDTTKFDIEGDWIDLSADAQITVDLEVGAAVVTADARAFEGHLRMVVDIKKVGAAEVAVALLVARIHACKVGPKS